MSSEHQRLKQAKRLVVRTQSKRHLSHEAAIEDACQVEERDLKHKHDVQWEKLEHELCKCVVVPTGEADEAVIMVCVF